MKRTLMLLIPVLAVTFAAPALAGGGKCTAGAQECLDYLSARFENRGWVGIEMDYDEEGGALAVTRVVEESPAAKAGFLPGDVLLAMNGVAYAEENEARFKEMEATMLPGAEFTFTVRRDGKKEDLEVILDRMPPRIMAQMIGDHMLGHANARQAEE